MAANRDTNQKRQRANRAQREALAARKTAAGTPRPSRQPPVAARRTGGEVKANPNRSADTAAAGGGRSRRVRPPRPGDTPVDVETLEGSFYRKVVQVPGGAQAAMGFILAVMAVGFSVALAVAVHTVPPVGTKANAKKVPGVDTAIDRYGWSIFVPLAVILAVATFAFLSSLRPYRRRAWIGAAMVTGVFVFLGQILFVFVAGMFAYAALRASKVEGPGEPLLTLLRRRPIVGREAPIEASASDSDD